MYESVYAAELTTAVPPSILVDQPHTGHDARFFTNPGVMMSVEEAVETRAQELLAEVRSRGLTQTDEDGQALSEEQCHQCSAWLLSAISLIHQICESPNAPYRVRPDRILTQTHGWVIPSAVGEAAAILTNLIADAKAGLLTSVADRARAETFDTFLEHAEAYYADNRKNEAGVIAGVVFEDTVRRICEKIGIAQKDVELDQLISALKSQGELSGVKAKRARVAADVRRKATHAQWDEFELSDVQATIELTHELIQSKLDA